MKKKIWFRAKNYGWGWYPITWQGWLCILVWVVLFSFGIVRMNHEWLKNFIFTFIFTVILIWICWKKGERPEWRWGRKKLSKKSINKK